MDVQCRTLFHSFRDASVNFTLLANTFGANGLYEGLEEGLKSTSRMVLDGEFPDSPGVKTWYFHCRGPGFEGTRILQAQWHSQKKKKCA